MAIREGPVSFTVKIQTHKNKNLKYKKHTLLSSYFPIIRVKTLEEAIYCYL
ncbi:hypothetical protein DCAR_0102769 [Daucus carota subsp. sativus]|uniref:Uncharacterized protein n=1 Tax=Daucus carota subsp. sativus TaxID=79200 RepID=A0A166H9T1_DAUCS|nr:hypothetical protein DCAR_0102769 [Daucus carota subsp. sativus]